MRRKAAKQAGPQVEPGSPEPLYKQLARILTQRIMQGELAPGAALSERDLAEQYSVTRDTVRGAIYVLGAHGLVRRQPRKGTVVADVSRAGQRLAAAPTILVRDSKPRSIPDTWFDGIYHGIQTAAQDMGYDLKRERLGDPLDVPLSQYEAPDPSNVGGVILCGIYDQRYMEMFRSERVPLVIADYWANDLVTDCVGVDVESEAYATVEFLARLGHRSVGLVAIGRMGHYLGRHEYDPDIHRFLGALRRAGPRHGMEIQDEWVLLTPTIGHLEAVCPGYLATRPSPTAIVCFGQWEGSVVLAAAKGVGLRCPHDFSLIDRRAGQDRDPALTSLVSDPELIGRMAVKLLSERMHGLRIRAAKLALSSQLVVGESTGPAPVRA